MHDLLSAGGSVDDLVELGGDGPAQGVLEPATSPTPAPAGHGDAVARQVAELLSDERELLDTRLSKARRLLDGLAAAGDRRDPGRFTTWDELVSEDDEDYRWLIPGVLEEQERVMIVAAEGVGKTMLARQVAICCAAGVHPFTLSRIDPVRTLLVDLENPERIIRRTARRIVESVRRNWPDRPAEEAHLWIKPDGVDVLKPADRARLEAVIERSRPKLLVLGPLYKAFVDPGGRSAEAVAIEVATYLDHLRTAYGVALWLEHHAPLGSALSGRDLRPMGSAVWMRWPEFGYALAPDPTAHRPEYLVKQWRGPRDSRQWPERLLRGSVLPFEQVQ
jgi:replicative DNA helicase